MWCNTKNCNNARTTRKYACVSHPNALVYKTRVLDVKGFRNRITQLQCHKVYSRYFWTCPRIDDKSFAVMHFITRWTFSSFTSRSKLFTFYFQFYFMLSMDSYQNELKWILFLASKKKLDMKYKEHGAEICVFICLIEGNKIIQKVNSILLYFWVSMFFSILLVLDQVRRHWNLFHSS